MRILYTIFVSLLFFNCTLIEQSNLSYKSFEELKHDYNGRGWFPSDFIYHSLYDIKIRGNLDVNTYIIKFSLNELDFKNLLLKVQPKKITFKKPHGIYLPHWWAKKIDVTDTYVFDIKDDISIKPLYVFVDKVNFTIYCWRE